MPPNRPSLPFNRRSLAPFALACLAPRPGAAHAVVVGSDPAAGATVAALPRAVIIRFNSRIDHARSRLVLVAPNAVQHVLDLASGEATPGEATPSSEPTQLQATLPAGIAAPPGGWRLRWQVLAIDGHITRGDIPFRLRAP